MSRNISTSSKPHLALLLMCKDEEKRIQTTLESVKGYVDSVVAYDTGSTDRTIEILENYCEANDIPLHLKQGLFVDFATSRNVSLDFADSIPEIDFLLLLDVNDELRGGDVLRKFLKTEHRENSSTASSAYMVQQHWFFGGSHKYYNIRLLRARCGWRYEGVVHEYVTNKNDSENQKSRKKVPAGVELYQDRTLDNNKSFARFSRDRELLEAEHLRDPSDTRTVYYLAQTYDCLNEYEEALKYFSLRVTMVGFLEEVFHSMQHCGRLCEKLKRPRAEIDQWFLKAYNHSNRAEPLVHLAAYYLEQNHWALAYMYASRACELALPEDALLFVDHNAYEYRRWHQLGIAAYYVNEFKRGKEACLKAIAARDLKVDRDNLKFYSKSQKAA